jgi:hypothetical protein
MLCPDCSRVAACSVLTRKQIKKEQQIRRDEQIKHEDKIRMKINCVIRKCDILPMINHFNDYLSVNRLQSEELRMVRSFIGWMGFLNTSGYCEDLVTTHKDKVYDIFLDHVLNDTDKRDTFKEILNRVGHKLSFEHGVENSDSDPDDYLYPDGDPKHQEPQKKRRTGN